MSAEERLHLIVNDARGNQRITTRSRRVTFACVAILIALASEVLAYHSISDNLIVFLTNEPLCWSNAVANNIQLGFTGAMNVIGIFGGWLSDTYIRRHYLIMIAYVIYILGYTFLLSATFFLPSSQSGSLAFEGAKCNSSWSHVTTTAEADDVRTIALIALALTLTSLAAGIIKTNLAVFGGEQVQERGPVAARQFFSMFYWATNIGALFTYVGVVFIQQKTGFFEGYLTSMAFLLASMLIYTAGIPFYIQIPAAGSNRIFRNLISMVGNAWRVKRSTPRLELPNLLDYANMENGGRFTEIQINDARSFYKACKVFLLMIPYFVCYSQMVGSIYLLQGLHLRVDFEKGTPLCPYPNNNITDLFCTRSPECRNNSIADIFRAETSENHCIDDHRHKIAVPAATLTGFNVICILVALPFVQKFYRFLASRHIRVFTWRRMVVGMILACCSLAAAAVLETFRLMNICKCGVQQQEIDYFTYDAAPGISIWCQIPQYLLSGASEIFIIVTGLEYAYMEAPRNMQGTVMGMFWFTWGLGNFIGLALPAIFSSIGFYKDPTYINNNRLDLFFYTLAGVLLIYAVIFGIVAKRCNLSLNKIIINRANTDNLLQESAVVPRNGSRIVESEDSGSESGR